jgi:hypothetical protein
MDFEYEFEHHKIPEFYEFYFEYKKIKLQICDLQKKRATKKAISVFKKFDRD